MKYLLITGIFALGISLGYVVGTQTAGSDATSRLVPGTPENETDTLAPEVSEEDELPAAEKTRDSIDTELDSLEMVIQDSLLLSELLPDSAALADEDLSISREKMIKGVRLPIIFLAEVTEKDTAIKDQLGIEEVHATSMFVEFWESPLNFEGYKLSKKKMIVYGMSPQFDYKIYRRESTYYFSYQNVYYKMKETQDFLPFSEVSKSEVFND